MYTHTCRYTCLMEYPPWRRLSSTHGLVHTHPSRIMMFFFRIIVFFWKKNNTCLNPFYNEMSITVVHKNLPPNHIKPRGQTQSQLPNVFTMWIKYLSRYTHACLYTQLHTYGHIQTRYIWYMYISFCPGGTTTVATESTSSSSSHKLYLIPPLNVLLVQRVCVCGFNPLWRWAEVKTHFNILFRSGGFDPL